MENRAAILRRIIVLRCIAMKKMLAVLIAVLLCAAMAAYAEAPTRTVAVAQNDAYVETNLGEGRAVTRLPADWTAIEAEYSDADSQLLGAYVNPEGTAMAIVTETKIDTASSADAFCTEAAAASLTGEVISYNDNTFACITAAGEDGHIVLMANYFVDDTTIIAFTFSYAADAQDAMQSVIEPALAGLTIQ